MRGEQKKLCEIKFGNYRRCKFGPHYLLAQDASLRQYIKDSLNYSADFFHSLQRQQFAAFCLFVRTLPIDFALLGRKRKYVRQKNLNRRSPSQIGTDWYIPDPPTFSLPTPFNLSQTIIRPTGFVVFRAYRTGRQTETNNMSQDRTKPTDMRPFLKSRTQKDSYSIQPHFEKRGPVHCLKTALKFKWYITDALEWKSYIT